MRLFFGDMRTFELPEKVDILVSELLGSFGDNELSPECLDGAMRFLKREHIVSPTRRVSSPLFSGRHFNTRLVHCAYSTVILVQAIQRDEDHEGREGGRNALRGDVPGHQHPQR